MTLSVNYPYVAPREPAEYDRCGPQWRTQEFFRGGGGVTLGIFFDEGSTNSVEDRGQRERGSGGGSPLVKGSTQYANE
jgi:hypothetical protein